MLGSVLFRLSGLYSHLEARTCSVYWQARAPLVLRHLNARPVDSVLELGCGVGPWTSYFTPRVRQYVAIDVDMASLRSGRLWRSPRAPLFPTAKTAFVQANGQELPFLDGAFTKVLAVDVLEHIPDDARAIREIQRVLRPGGRVVVTTLLTNRPSYLRRLTFSDHQREYTRRSLLDLFTSAGFTEVRTVFFYFAPSLIARELQVLVEESRLGSLPGIELILAIPLRLLASVDRLVQLGDPAGIGIVATRPELG